METERKFRFVSNRSVKNKAGQDTGKMKVLVKINSETAEVDYKCPECLHEEHIAPKWERPFAITCSKCKFEIKLPKLKEEMKKEKDKEKKKKQEELLKNFKASSANSL